VIALCNNSEGEANVALGHWALHDNTSGSSNVAVGDFTLVNNTTADNNTAVGAAAMEGNTTGFYNAAFGSRSMNFNTTGRFNTALGSGTLSFNTAGESNTAVGFASLNQVTTGTGNTALGALAGTTLITGSNNIEIGHTGGSASESNTIRIGTRGTQTATYIAGIRGVALGALQQVGVNAQGQLGVRGSAARFKEAIKPIAEQSEAILSLHPVSFRYKKELDPSGDAQFGLVAEEVAKVAPELVVHDEQGKPLSVRYEEVNAMLLNEFLKAHAKLEAQDEELAKLKATLKEQAAQIQKVNARLETSAPELAAQAVEN